MAHAEDSEARGWRAISSLLGADASARVGLIGAPLAERALTPGRYDLAPGVVRRALARMSVYDLETGADLSARPVFDAGDLDLKLLSPAEAFAPIRASTHAEAARRDLVILLGGHNGVTRGGVHGLAKTAGGLERVGLLTLDAHFDLRDTDHGLTNGNPVRALIEDGLPGAHVIQIGLQPFANSKRMHDFAKASGVRVFTAGDAHANGAPNLVAEALSALASRCETIFVDLDIDVIDRAQMPAAPGARPGGLSALDVFACARIAGAHPKVAGIDLVEFDPGLEVGDIGALTAARIVAEILTGAALR